MDPQIYWQYSFDYSIGILVLALNHVGGPKPFLLDQTVEFLKCNLFKNSVWAKLFEFAWGNEQL